MPSPNVPNPKSYEQILGDALSGYASSLGITDFNVGSLVTSFFETVSLATARASGDIFQILKDNSVTRATGSALQLLATENGITPITASPATGFVTVTDLSFSVISAQIYTGTPAPNAGSVTIYVGNASFFPSAGSVYLGVGTPNVEGPIAYSTAPAQTGNYWTITLNAATTKYHNLGETVLLAQGGNRSIPVNTIVVAPSIGANPSVQYAVTTAAVILDGETTITNVPVTAQLPGTVGNVPIGTISSFAANPSGLPNASVTNPGKFTTGQDNETDDSLRTRIIAKLSSTGLGTAFAIKSGVIGAQASDESSATLVSDDLLETSYGSVLFVDDGTLYEAKFAGVGIESIITSAIGGEQFFQLATGGRQAPVTKAFLISSLSAPFDVVGGDSLAIVIGGNTSQHNFVTSDFRSPGSATAYEITASINADSALSYEAATSGNGSYVVIRPKGEGHDTIQITTPVTDGNDVAVQLGLPSSQYDTLRLYKNNIPLSQDGNTATVTTAAQSLWNPSIADGDTLILSVDGTASITYTIRNSDFVATGLYTSVSATNSLASWVEVFNNKLTGITAEAVGAAITLTSNLGASNRASVVVNPNSTLLTKGMFSSTVGLSSTGHTSDYTLDRNTAQIELVTPLVAGDTLSAGSDQTEAMVSSGAIAGGTVTLSSAGYLWLLIDNPGTIIPTGIIANSIIAVSKPATNVIRYTADTNPTAFSNVQIGDYLIVWSPDLIAANRVEGRVHAVTDTTLDVVITPAEYAAVVPTSGITYTQGFVVLRSTKAPQKFEIPAATYTLDQVVTQLQAQSDSVIFAQEQELYLTVTTNSNDPAVGSLLVVTSDVEGQILSFVPGTTDQTEFSLIALYDSQSYDTLLPLFIHSTVANGTNAYPPDSFIETFNSTVSLAGRSPNEIIGFLQPYGIPNAFSTTGNITALSNQLTNLASTTGLSFGQIIVGSGIPLNTTVVSISGTTITMSNNATTTTTGVSLVFNTPSVDAQPFGEYVQESYPPPSGNVVNISYPNPSTYSDLNSSRNIRRLRGVSDGSSPVVADRYFVASPLDFGPNDTIVAVVNNDPTNETFDIPLFRVGITNTGVASNPSTFDAYDYSAGPTASFANPNTFGPHFDFSNFKVLLQAKTLLTPTPANTSLLYRSTAYGNSGENIAVGYVYPTAANQAIGSTVTVTELTQALINLASGAAISSAINSTTEWNVTITANTPTTGIDQVTYTWNGVGTSPGLTLSGGEYVNISTNTEFSSANTGVFRVSTASGFAPTSTQFTVQRPNGVAVAESNKATQVNGSIIFYAASSTTATAISAYVNANLSQYFTTSNATGSTGSGIIVLSTFEDSGFTNATVSLQDGVNWIASSNLGGSPQFTLKEPLSYPYDSAGYAFNNGEQIILSPTTMDQVNRFISVLGVTGFTTDGTTSVVDRGSRLELATKTLGSAGSIQILGGLGNEYQVPVLYSATRVNNQLMNISVNNISGQGIQSDQWFRLQATMAQAKETLVSSNTGVTIIPNSPTTGQSTINLLNQNLTQRYFGKPRALVTPSGATFKVEAQGSLVCISWTGVGSNPNFESALNFNATGGGTLNVSNISSEVFQYNILTGSATFSALSIGDLVTISGLANSANNGTFLVTAVSSDGTTIQVLNPNGSNEFSSGTITVNSNPNPGDTITVGSTVLTAVASSPTGNQFLIGVNSAATAVNLSALVGTVPGVTSSVSGSVITVKATTALASVALASSNTGAITVSGSALSGDSYNGSTFSATSGVSEGDTVIITAPFNVLNQGQFRVIREYNNSIWIENAEMVPEEVVVTSNSQMVFYEYEATVPGDVVNITSNNFLPANVGKWTVVEVLSPTSVVVNGTMSAVTNVNLNGILSSFFVAEGVPYSGYKRVLFTAPQTGSTTTKLVTFDTNAQSDKIDQVGGVQLTSLNKLNFNTVIKFGLDSYRYNTGMIAEANRIIYGDPRDNTTYPGIGAAGTDIFVQEPLALRIQVSLAIRLNTGVPFAQTVIQVQDSVSSLINSNGLGQPISISSIVSAVQAIPGIISVAVNFPSYSVSNDLINLATGQKAFIIDPTTDVNVSLIG